MKIGIYGGSFNPVHFGHIGLVKWVIGHTDLDEIWMLVSPNNPLKDSKILGGEAERLKGAKEAVAALNDPRVQVSDFEFSLPRPSYTAATLQALREHYPEHEFVLIIGQDNWDVFDKWKDYEEILRLHEVIVYPRISKLGEARAACRVADTFDRLECKRVRFLEGAPYFDISSTEIREQSNTIVSLSPARGQ